FQRQRCSVEMECFILRKHFCRQSAGGRWWKCEVPIFNARRFSEMFTRVLVCGYFRAHRMKPFVTVSVIEVPMRVNQVLDRIAAEGIERLGDLSSGAWDPCVDEKFAVAPREHGDLSARDIE